MMAMQSFQDLIDKFGVPRLAAILGIGESHVRVMKTRNSIPPEYWGTIVDHRVEAGLDDIDLARLHRLRKERFEAPSPPPAPASAEERAA